MNISIEYLLGSNIRKPLILKDILDLPYFCLKFFANFNMCKFIKPIDKLTNHEFLYQPIWLNNLFCFENKPILFKNWSNSDIFYVKDLYKRDGSFFSQSDILSKIKNTRNGYG